MTSMDEGPLIVEIFPKKELFFNGPFTKAPVSFIHIRNLSDTKNIGFKVKTTAPSWYVVKPNTSTLGPGGECNIQITFTIPDGEKLDFPLDHKFLIQLVYVEGDETDINKIIRSCLKQEIQQCRLKCVFNSEYVSKHLSVSKEPSFGLYNSEQNDDIKEKPKSYNSQSEISPEMDSHIRPFSDNTTSVPTSSTPQSINFRDRNSKIVSDRTNVTLWEQTMDYTRENEFLIVALIFMLILGLILGKFIF